MRDAQMQNKNFANLSKQDHFQKKGQLYVAV